MTSCNQAASSRPEASPAITTVDGQYTLNSGTLQIEIGGLLAGTEYDMLDVTGSVLLGGALEVVEKDLGNGYIPLRWRHVLLPFLQC